MVKKYRQLENEEKYLVDTVSDFMTTQNVKFNLPKVKIGLVTKYINSISSVNLSTDIPIYELCLELLYNLEQINDIDDDGDYPSSDDEYNKAYEYEHGCNRYTDLSVAKYWYTKSAEKGNLAAKRALIRLGIK